MKFKINDLIVSTTQFDTNTKIYYKVTKVKKSSLIVDVIANGYSFWSEIPFTILDDYTYLLEYKNKYPELFL